MSTKKPGMSQTDLEIKSAQQPSTFGRTAPAAILPLGEEQLELIDSTGLKEGWRLSQVQGGSLNGKCAIEREDESNVFADDHEAEAFVRKQAEQGSRIHQWVLASHLQPIDTVVGKFVNVRLTLDVAYLLNGVSIEDIQAQLKENMFTMIGNGGLTGPTEAVAENYCIEVSIMD